MQKYGKWIFILVGIIVVCAIIYFLIFSNSSQNSPSSTADRLSLEINTEKQNMTSDSSENKEISEIVETEIAKFSTDILIDDDNRDNNLKLTASKINEHIVKNGEEFSFNEVVGNPSPDKGYKKAGIFVNGKKVKGYGGGNCQISTTLYDAVLKVDGLEVTERHEHGKEVGYVKQGQDATVTYDELDLKFKNNTGFDIKIYSDVTDEKVNVKIVKLSA